MKKQQKLSIVQKYVSLHILKNILSGAYSHKSQVKDICLNPVASQIESKSWRVMNKMILDEMTVNSFFQAIDWMTQKGLLEKTQRADSFIITKLMFKDVVLSYARQYLSEEEIVKFAANFKQLK